MHLLKPLSIALLSTLSFAGFAQDAGAPAYGRDILSVSPVQLSELTPTGIGIQYEHVICSHFSLYLPFAYSFGHADPCQPLIRAHAVSAYPGVRWYPAGYNHKLTYAVGPSLAVTQGNTNGDNASLQGTHLDILTRPIYKSLTEAGAIINNSLNLQATPHLILGAELGIGASIINTRDSHDMGSDLMLQANFRVGYRF